MNNEQNTAQNTVQEPVNIPYVVYRDLMAHTRWTIKSLIIALIVAVVLMFASNGIWVYYWNQYDFATEETVTTVDSEGDGIANFTGGDGGVIYGPSDSP